MAWLKRDIELNIGDLSIREDQSFKPIGMILRFKKGTTCKIENHFNTGSLNSTVEISFPQYFGDILLYKVPDTFIDGIDL